MQYELKIDLVGGEKAESILQKLSGLSGALGSGGSIFGGGSGGSSPVAKQAQDVERLARQVEKGKAGVHALGKELKNLGQSVGVSFSKGKGAGMASAEQWKGILSKMSPEDRAFYEASTGNDSGGGNSSKSKFKGVLWGSKSILQGQFPATPQWLKNISMDEAFKSKSVGGGIDGISGDDAFSRFEKEHGNMFGSSLDWKLREMRRKSDEKFARQSKEEKGEMHGTDLGGIMLANFKKKQLQDANAFKMDMLSLVLPLANPMSPWSTMWGAKNVFKGMNTEHGAAFRASKLGGMEAAGATALLVGGATAAGLALKALTITVKQTLAAYENARQIYSKALQNGMGLQWTTKWSLLAQIMGVSEQDVFRFGAQMEYLNPQLEQASKILAQTNPALTQVSWNWKVLLADFSAMAAKIAEKLAPAANDFIDTMDDLVKVFTALIPVVEKLKYASPAWYLWQAMRDHRKNDDPNNMPPPQSWMKQIPASSWEHMGLVIGGGTRNYAKETAKNTGDMVKYLQRMAMKVPFVTPMGTFNMSALTANP